MTTVNPSRMRDRTSRIPPEGRKADAPVPTRGTAEAQTSRAARHRRWPDNKWALFFLAPWLVGMIGLTIGPLLVSLGLSFTNYNLVQPARFAGLANYKQLFLDPRLHHSLQVTFTYVLVGVPAQLIIALALAVFLNTGLRGLRFYRSAFYLPSLLGSSVAIAVLWRLMFGGNGLFNQLLNHLGINATTSWIGSPDTAIWAIIALHVWMFGSPMIIFLAGLRQIPKQQYEAAEVDGANKLQLFTNVTVPGLTPVIFFNLVLGIIQAFQAFTQAYIVSNGSGGPTDSTLFYTLYLYQEAFGQFNMGYASAMAWLLVCIIAAFTGLMFLGSKYWVNYND